MAIVKMKKLRLLVCRKEKDELLRELMLLGSIELSEQTEVLSDETVSALVSKPTNEAMAYRTEKTLLADSIKLLDRYAPAKSSLLSAKPMLSEREFLDDSELEKVLSVSHTITDLNEKIKNCYAEQAHCTSVIEMLTPWKDLQIPLETEGDEHYGVRLGSMPVMSDMDALSAQLDNEIGAVELEEVSHDEHTRFFCVIFLKDKEAETMEILRRYGFAMPNFAGITGYPKDNLDALMAQLEGLEKDREYMSGQVVAYAPYRDQMKLCYDRMSVKENEAEAQEKLLATDQVVCLSGWSAVPEEEKLLEILKSHDCAFELTEPEEEEYGEVPVLLKNNKFTNGLNMVTNMYSLPRYGSVDPNPWMAPFFILFYGIMMADMGYGLLMIIAGLVVMKKMRAKDGLLTFSQLMFWGGISTFIMGALTGGFFCDMPLQVAKMINPDTAFTGLPAVFSPLDDSILVLGGALVLGVIHMNVGLLVSFIEKVKHKDTLGAILYEGALWVILIGGLMFAASAFLGAQALAMPAKIVLIIGALALFAGSVRGKKGFGIITAIFGTVYNELTGWFGDILSYSRIMALMLAGSVVGQVFNTIGAMFGPVVFVIVFLIGHALNFGLNLLGCYVHDLRLQCLEFFKKFYVDGGKPFAPLKIKTKYVDVTK